MVIDEVAAGGAPPEGAGDPDTKAIEGRSLRQIALTRLKRDKPTLIAMAFVAFFILCAVVAPILVSTGVLDPTTQHQELLGDDASPRGAFGGASSSHWLGVVPQDGSDVLSRLMYGLMFSLLVGLGATAVAISLGLVLGLISGFSGGKVDFLTSRLIDLVLCFPQTLLLLALSGTMIKRLQSLGLSNYNVAAGAYVILVLGLFGWPTFARIVRGQVMSLRNREFVEAARSLGASQRRIYFTELLPNLWAPVLVYSTLLFPVFVSSEAALGFLGVGIKAPTPTIGNMINDCVQWAQNDPMYFCAPILTLALLVLTFNLVGDGLRDALDPKADRH